MNEMYYAHASYTYLDLTFKDYLVGSKDLVFAKLTKAKNITFHLPVELMLPSRINTKKGTSYVNFIEGLSKKLGVSVVWENIAFLSAKDWSLIEQSIWSNVPKNINLCLDTGHLMLGEKHPRKRVKEIFKKFKKQIKHLHIHENDLIHDQHLPPGKVINQKLLKEITKGRTWIIEPQS